jgi:hypothetical protein
MRRTLETRLRVWDDRRRMLLDEVEGLEPERLVARPLPGKWSILEIVEHLVLADRECLQGLPNPSHLVDRKRGLKNRVSYPFVMFVLACHIPAKVPSLRYIPRGESSLAELRREWDEIQQWLRSYVDGLDQGDQDKAVFAHPIAGPMTAQQYLHMGELHLATHTRQIRRLESLTN